MAIFGRRQAPHTGRHSPIPAAYRDQGEHRAVGRRNQAFRRDPAAVIADFLNQFVADEPDAFDRRDARTLIRWLHDEGWQITPTRGD